MSLNIINYFAWQKLFKAVRDEKMYACLKALEHFQKNSKGEKGMCHTEQNNTPRTEFKLPSLW